MAIGSNRVSPARGPLHCIASAIVGAGIFFGAATASAQDDWPAQKPVTLLVGFGPGGTTDAIARLLAPRLREALGQSVVVENRPGVSGSHAGGLLVQAPPDGYTLWACTNSSLTIHHRIFKHLRFDTGRDIQPVSQVSSVPYLLLVGEAKPFASVQAVLDFVRARPGEVSFGSAGVGTMSHLAAELFLNRAGARMTHVPFKGSGPAMTDLAGGHIVLAFDQEASAAPYLASGKLRPLAITSAQRSATLPDVPTFAEAGLPIEADAWTGLCVRKGTPEAIVARLAAAVRAAMADPELLARYRQLGMMPRSTTPEAFAALVRDDTARYGKLIEDLGIEMQ